MTQEEKRDATIKDLVELLKNNPFSMEFKAVKKPKGIRVIYEMTQEEMDMLMKIQREREGKQ